MLGRGEDMVGWLTPEEGRGRLRLEQEQVRGLSLLRACVPLGRNGRRWERRLRRAALKLHESGVRRVLVPEGFEHWALLEEAGLCGVDPLPLCRAMATRLILTLLEWRGVDPARAVVLLRGTRVDRHLFETAHALCPRVRTLVVSVPQGGEALCRCLREEYGAAVPEAAGGLHPDAAADFAPVEPALPDGLRLYGPVPGLAGLELSPPGAVLPDADRLPLLALLWEEGRIPLGEITISAPETGQISLTEG